MEVLHAWLVGPIITWFGKRKNKLAFVHVLYNIRTFHIMFFIFKLTIHYLARDYNEILVPG
jgi:hypothetical protein